MSSRGKTSRVNGNGARSFQDASKQIQENLKRHLAAQQEDNLVSDSDSESGEDEEHETELISRLLTQYNGIDSQVVAGVVETLKNSLQYHHRIPLPEIVITTLLPPPHLQ